MTAEDLASASRLIDLLKAKGARSFKGFGIELELSPADAPAPVSPAVGPDASLCACGHRDYEHGGGLCLQGCEPTSCERKAT